MTATEARINFGELIRRVTDSGEPVVVERGGKPRVVVLSIERYEQLLACEQEPESWSELVDRARARVLAELGDRDLPPPEEILRQGREDRDAELLAVR
jgi:prevent-host-death family protein